MPGRRRSASVAASLLALSLLLCGHGTPHDRPAELSLSGLSTKEQDRYALDDLETLKTLSQASARLRDSIVREAALFEKAPEAPLTADERTKLLSIYEQVLAHVLAFEHIGALHFQFWKIVPFADRYRHARHYVLAYAAFVEKLHLALTFIQATLGKRQFEVLLDEGAPELALGPGTYGQLKYKAVHVDAVSLLLSGFQYHRLMVTAYGNENLDDPVLTWARLRAEQLYPQVAKMLRQDGIELFVRNGFDILTDGAYQAWFPVQTTVAVWLGRTRLVRDHHTFLIGPHEIKDVVRQGRPGDIVFVRRDWFASNLAMPGYWSHVGLYVGSPEELHHFFDHESEVTALFGRPFTQALAARHPRWWRHYTLADDDGNPHRFIEAVGAGVIQSSAEHALRADHAAAVRPRLSRVELALAIDRAFSYVGRPYDYDFDFFSDTSLVCTELIYKAYEPREGVKGLHFSLQQIAGRTSLVPNYMVQRLSHTLTKEDRELDFLWFLDGDEDTGEVTWASEEEFRESYRRIKWTVIGDD